MGASRPLPGWIFGVDVGCFEINSETTIGSDQVACARAEIETQSGAQFPPRTFPSLAVFSFSSSVSLAAGDCPRHHRGSIRNLGRMLCVGDQHRLSFDGQRCRFWSEGGGTARWHSRGLQGCAGRELVALIPTYAGAGFALCRLGCDIRAARH